MNPVIMETQDINNTPSFWGVITALIWVGFSHLSKEQRTKILEYLAENQKIISSFSILIFPFLFPYLASHKIPGIFSQLAIATFILGLILQTRQKEIEKRDKESEVLKYLHHQLDQNHRVLEETKEQLNRELKALKRDSSDKYTSSMPFFNKMFDPLDFPILHSDAWDAIKVHVPREIIIQEGLYMEIASFFLYAEDYNAKILNRKEYIMRNNQDEKALTKLEGFDNTLSNRIDGMINCLTDLIDKIEGNIIINLK